MENSLEREVVLPTCLNAGTSTKSCAWNIKEKSSSVLLLLCGLGVTFFVVSKVLACSVFLLGVLNSISLIATKDSLDLLECPTSSIVACSDGGRRAVLDLERFGRFLQEVSASNTVASICRARSLLQKSDVLYDEDVHVDLVMD